METPRIYKYTVVLAILAVAILLVVAITQTAILNNLKQKQNALNAQNNQIEQDISEIDKEIAVRENQEFTDDYLEQENNYGNKGDVILKK